MLAANQLNAAGYGEPVPTIAPVFSELDRLDSAIDNLRGNLNALRAKVGPIASFEPKTETANKPEAVPCCAVEERIIAAIRVVNNLDANACEIYRALRV